MKRLLLKSFAFVPILFCYYIFQNPITIYIKEINLDISDTLLPIFTILYIMIWMEFSPYMENCEETVAEICFFLLPVEIFLLVVFAQYHFSIAIALVAFIVGINLFFSNRLHSNIEDDYAVVKSDQFAMISSAIILLIPSLISIFCYNLQDPLYEARLEIWNSLFEDEIVCEEIDQEYRTDEEQIFKFLKQENWNKLNVEERTAVIQALVDYEMHKLGVSHEYTVRVEKLDEYVLGMQDASVIIIDLAHLQQDPINAITKTVLHESYHAYQHYIIKNVDWESDVSQTVLFAEAAEWKDNMSSYISSDEDYEGYLSQPLEASAIAFAEEELEWIIAYK